MPKVLVSFSWRAAFLCLALAVFNPHSPTVLGGSALASVPPAGELILAGSVHVDGATAIPGQTFFSGMTFVVGAASRSTLTLGNHARLEMAAETALKLDFSDNQVTGTVTSGRLRVFAPAGVSARLMTEDATLVADSRQPAVFSVESERGGGTTISVEAGEVEMSFGNRTQLVTVGQMLSTLEGSPGVPNARKHLGSFKRNALEFGLAGLLSIVTLVLAGNGGRDEGMMNFGGTVCIPSPGAGDC